MSPVDLEAVVHRELQQLPLPRAPRTLVPRVLTAVQAWSRRPWYERAWFTWPAAWQIASVAALLLVVAGGITLVPRMEAGADHVRSMFTASVIARVSSVAEAAETTATAARVIWGATLEPLAPYVLALVVLMCLACGLFGTALTHVASGRILHR